MTAPRPPAPPLEAPDARRRRVRTLALWVALAAFLAHLGFVPGEPGWVGTHETLNYDDPQVVAAARDTSVAHLLDPTKTTYYAYKPLYFLSLKVDLLFDGDAAGFGHVVNLLLFALAAFLLVGLLHDVLGSTWLAGAVGLLFAVHPVHVESVAWLSGRKDVLSLVFVLLAHRAYRRRREDAPEGSAGVSWGAAALLLAGGLTKGTVWTWAGVLALDEALERGRGARPGAWKRLLPCVVVALAGIAFDAWTGVRAGPGAVEHGVPTASLMAAMAGVHLAYVTTLLAPVGLSLDYGVSPAGAWSSPAAWAGLALAVAAVAGLFVALKRGRALVALALGLWVCSLAPVNNVWPRTTTLMADRYLLTAALGVYLLLAWLLARAGAARAWVLGTAALLLGVLSVARTRTFADSATVWADATSKAPGSALAWVQRAHEEVRLGRWPPALEHTAKALALEPRPEIALRARLVRCGALLAQGDVDALLAESGAAAQAARALRSGTRAAEDPREMESSAWVFHGKALEALGEKAGAREDYRRAVALDPESATAHANLGHLLTEQTAEGSSLEDALRHLARAHALAPGDVETSIKYATVLAMAGRHDEALRVFKKAEEGHGRTPEILLARSGYLLAAGQTDAALADLRNLLREHPHHPRAVRTVYDLYVRAGTQLLDEGRTSKEREPLARAQARFEDARKLEPAWLDAWVGLGDVLYEQGRTLEARDTYRKALATKPDATWVRGLVVRATALEAAFVARHAKDDAGRRASARLLADALAEGTDRIDLGLVPLEAELPLLRSAAALLRAGAEPAAGWAGTLLAAAALLAAGDDPRALELLRPALSTAGEGEAPPDLVDLALLLRAGIRERAALLPDAAADYALLERRRPGDPIPALRRLHVELRAAVARRRVTAGSAPSAAQVREAHEELWVRGAKLTEPSPGDVEAVEAVERARAVLLDAARLEQADRDVEEASARVVAFADARPEVVDAGLLAAEAEMRRERWVDSLRRLNDLAERFPKNPSVLRGQALVYENQYMAMGVKDRSLLEEARVALHKATELDPRDPRTALDASQVRRLSGDRRGALALARRARTFEIVPGGPAAQTVAALLLADGGDAVDAGDVPRARKLVEASKRENPAAAGPWLLEARIELERERDETKALIAAMRAKELEPANLEADRMLSRIHWTLGSKGRLAVFGVMDPPHPAEDRAAWKALDIPGQQKAIAAYEAKRKANHALREAYRARAIENLEAALREDPGGEHAEPARQALESLRRSDPESQRERLQKAGPLFVKAKQDLDERRFVDAYLGFEEVLRLDGTHVLASFYLVQAGYERLVVGGMEDGQRREVTNRIFDRLQALDGWDPEGRFPLRHLYRGLINQYLWKRSQQADARLAAVKAFERFVTSQVGLVEPDRANVEFAQRQLKDLR